MAGAQFMALSKLAFLPSHLTGLDKSSPDNYLPECNWGLPASFPALIFPDTINQLIYQMDFRANKPQWTGYRRFGLD